MSWQDIKSSGISKDPKILERRRITRLIIDMLHKNLPNRDRSSVFQIGIDRFLTQMYKQHKLSPSEILVMLMERPDLLRAIYRNKFKQVKDKLLALENETVLKERTFVTLFYDRYNSSHSFFKAVLQAYKYPLESFSRSFVHNVFMQYPFLRDKKHLEHVVYLLRQVGSAYYLTQTGIKEEYTGESLLSHMDCK